MSSIGLPGLNGFVSEFLTILGAFTSTHLGIGFGVLAATGVVLGAVYMLHMCARVIWGPLKTPGEEHDHGHTAHGHAHGQADQGQAATPGHDHGTLSADIGGREIAILIPIAVLVVLLGVLPNIILKTIEGPSSLVTSREAVTVTDVAQAESPAVEVSLKN